MLMRVMDLARFVRNEAYESRILADLLDIKNSTKNKDEVY